MQAVALYPDGPELRVIEKADPVPSDDEVLVRTLRVGIDGSDRRIVAGDIGGECPAGSDHLVIGHEAVGVVEDPNESDFETGDVVVPMVRRPTAEPLRFAETGELDMAPPGAFSECGITGAHGYMVEYFTADPEYLVPIPDSLDDYGIFVEPASIAEKALDQAFAARSGFDWRPETAFVLGNGNLGLLALARFSTGEEFDRTYCLGRRDRPDPTIEFVESVGGTYVDSRETELREFPAVYEPADFVFETTGYPRHAIEAAGALGPNGIVTLQGIPDESTFEVEGGGFHSDLVVNNKGVLGVVNSRRPHLEGAVEWLQAVPPSLLDALVSGVYAVEDVEEALSDGDERIKTVVSFEK
ncbi:glucose 1-dehydrogenase [Haloarcula sp. Atlit-7R]|uniref:glucose 1-dehydrogenase n=1 Tax=Haloarcula sp. Atlit-7R TaxID=2282125 RepID=UPI000EF172B1|nr:glucose 1-dehydrogenase [Haloarcula sp. Atlit-7R]RLM90024.1 glucose dehydrogenase [Haloarcula sp. Atlit-7R]